MVIQITNRYFPSNTYLVIKDGTDKCLIIDPGLDFESIDSSLKKHNLDPVAILCTHGHFDHIGCIAELKVNYHRLPYYLHEADLKLAKSANFFTKLAKINNWIAHVDPDHIIRGKSEKVQIQGFEIEFENYPGHSAGSCVIKHGNLFFTGDLIYKNGVGFNNFPGENKKQLKASILGLFEVNSDVMIYPGHGESDTLSNIKTNNTTLINFLHSEQ